MKKRFSETIDGSIKNIIQLKTLDASLEYSQMYDALEDCPDEFKSKLIGALNSLGETMGVSPCETFNKVLCKSDDGDDVKKKLYNWWRAVFEVLSNCKVPDDRMDEYNQKVDDLMAEVMKAGDAAATDEQEEEGAVVAEEYEPASLEDEAKMLDNMEFAIQHLGEVASKVQALVNFVNPYCGTEVNESGEGFSDEDILAFLNRYTQLYGWGVQDVKSALRGEISPGFKCAILDALPVKGHPAYNELVKRMGPIMCQIVDKNRIYRESNRITEEDDSMKKKMNEQAMDGGPWLPENEIIGMKVTGEAEEEPINWDDEDSYNDGGFERGMWVIWTDPDTDEESVWKILEMPKSEDDCFVLGQKDGSINEVPGWEIRPRDADPEEYVESDGVQLNAQEFVDAMIDADEDMGDVFEVYDGGVEDDDTVYLNVLAHKESVSNKEVEDEFKDEAAEYGWKFESFGYSSDMVDSIVDDDNCALVVYFKKAGEQQMNEEKVENELKKGDDGWTEIGQPVGESGDETHVEPQFKVGDKVNWIEPDKGYPSDGWTIEDVTSGKYPGGDDLYIISRGKSSVMNIRGSELRPEGMMNEAQVVVDANDVWSVLELLDDEKAKKNLIDLINSHVRTEDEIMDAIDTVYPDNIRKGELNLYMKDSFDEIVSELGLDVEKFKETGEFVDSDKPTSVELESDQKFNVGDEITWRHHNGSLSNEVVRELTDGGYIVDDGFAGENECYPGHAPEELLGKPNMEWDGKEWKQGIGMAEGTEEQKPEEVKSKDKTFNQDGENKTLVTGEENNKPVCEMTIEQEIDDPWKLSEMLWSQGKENLEELLRSELVEEEDIMMMLEDSELRNLTSINDAFAFDFPSILDSLGLDGEAWSQNLEIKRKGDDSED